MDEMMRRLLILDAVASAHGGGLPPPLRALLQASDAAGRVEPVTGGAAPGAVVLPFRKRCDTATR